MTTNILVIDDSADDRRLYQRAFRDSESRFTLLEASSAADGFARLAEAKPDLILLDFNLPDMDGLSFIRKLAEYAGSPIPIIMLTGESSAAVAVEAMKNGVDDYLVKDTGGQYLKLLPGVAGHVMTAHSQRMLTAQMRQQTEALLHRNQALMQNSMDGIHVMDPRGNLVEANDAFCQMLGYTWEEAARLNVSDWDARWSAEELQERFEDHLVNRSRFETQHRRKDGALIDVEVSTFGMQIDEQYFVYAASRDITARKKTEAMLMRHKQVIDTSLDGFWVNDLQGNLLEANQAYATMSGYTVEELTNMHISQLEATEQPADVVAHTEKIIAQGHDRFETRHRRKDGREIDVEVSVTYMAEAQQIFAFFRDITERKRAEGVLKLNKTIIEIAHDGFWMYDTDGYLLDVNQAYADMIGYAREELVGKHISQLSVQSNTPELVRARIEKAIGQGFGNFETQHRHKDGRVMDFEASIAYIPEASCLFSFIRDVTARKKTEAILKRHKQVIDTSLDGFWVNDMQGNLLEANQAYANMSGYSVEELMNMHISQLEAAEQPADTEAHIAKILAQGHDRFETRHRRKDGREFDVEVSATYIADVQQIFAFFRDITEHNQAEEKLKLGMQLLNSTSDSVFLFGLDGKFVFLNEAAWKSRGYTREEMMAMTLSELNTPKFKKLIAPRIKELLENGHGIFESEHYCKDGSIISVEISSRLIESGGRKLVLAAIRDTTWRKRQDDELRQSEANLRAILDNSPYRVWLKDAESRYISINKVYANNLRMEGVDQVVGMSDFDFFPKELAEKYRTDDVEVMASRVQKYIEEQSLEGDKKIWVETWKTPVIDDSGKVWGTAGFASDITERKSNEEALRIAAVTFDTHDAIVITDAAANIIKVNRAFTEISGYSAEEVLGRNPRMMRSGRHDRAFYVAMWQQLLRTGSWAGEIWDKRKNGQIYPKWMTITALKNELMEITHYVSISSDITARVEMEEALLWESDERFRGTLEQAAVGIAHAGLDGVYKQINQKFSEILGYSSGELIKLSFQEVTFPEDLDKDALYMQHILAGEIETFTVEKRYMRKDHSLVWVQLTVSLLHQSDGSPKYFIFVVEDITNRKRSEQKIHRLNNLYLAITRANEAIIRIGDRDKLLEEICRIAVEFGRFKLAWVGLMDGVTPDLKVIASSGEATGYLSDIRVTVEENQAEGRGPTGMAIRNNREYICNDFRDDPCCLPWREQAQHHGLRASAAYPLELEGQVSGALTLYADEENYFDQDMTNLLIMLAKDISVALNNFVLDDRRKLAEQQLRELSGHLQTVREDEKANVAREIHDDLGGTLTALKMDAYWLGRNLHKNNIESLQERIGAMTGLLDNAVNVTRRIITDLRPTILDDLGLLAALEWQCGQFQKRSGIKCGVLCSDSEDCEKTLDKVRAINLFRIFQEALTNVARHSGATRVEAELHHSEQEVVLVVRDNGRGLPKGKSVDKTSYGLRGMSERAAQLGGKVEFGSAPGGGFSLTVSLPLKGDVM